MYKITNRTIIHITAAVLITVSLSAQAQLTPALRQVSYHQYSMQVIRDRLRFIEAASVDEPRYNKAAVEANVAIIETMLRRDVVIANRNIENSKGGAEIWKEQRRFQEAAGEMQKETTRLADAAISGDLSSIKAALNGVKRSCMACHANYRIR